MTETLPHPNQGEATMPKAPAEQLMDQLSSLERVVHTARTPGGPEAEDGMPLFMASNETADLIANVGELPPSALQEMTTRLRALLPGRDVPPKQSTAITNAVGRVFGTYAYNLPLDDVPMNVLHGAAEIALATSNSSVLGDIAQSVFKRDHNNLFTDQAPSFVRDKRFTATLMGDFMVRATMADPEIDPRSLLQGGSVEYSQATCLHLVSLGFSFKESQDIARCWGTLIASDQATPAELNERLQQNISTIEELESVQPGLALKLHRERGIAHFGRYPIRLLQKQFEALPPGVDPDFLFLTYTDHNTVMTDVVEELATSLGEEDLDNMRIAEGGTTRALKDSLNDLTAQFGRVRNLMIGAHGEPEDMLIGPEFAGAEFAGAVLNIGQVDHELSELADCVLPGGTIILFSCSTGAEGGIGTEIAQTFDRQVQAPVIPAALNSARRLPSGNLEVEFTSGATRRIIPNKRDLKLAA